MIGSSAFQKVFIQHSFTEAGPKLEISVALFQGEYG